MHRFQDLKIWKKSIEFTLLIYQVCNDFPEDEKFGLVSQMKRAAVSISSNIAEGSGRNSDKDFDRFLSMAIGSSFEIQTQIILSNKLGFIKEKEFTELIELLSELQKMIIGFRKKINKGNAQQSKV